MGPQEPLGAVSITWTSVSYNQPITRSQAHRRGLYRNMEAPFSEGIGQPASMWQTQVPGLGQPAVHIQQTIAEWTDGQDCPRLWLPQPPA